MKKRTVKTALQAARELIEDPKRWTCGAFFRSKHGNPLEKDGDDAVRFCVLGSIVHVASEEVAEKAQATADAKAKEMFGRSVLLLNDGGHDYLWKKQPLPSGVEVPHTRKERHQAVLKVLDEAIKAA